MLMIMDSFEMWELGRGVGQVAHEQIEGNVDGNSMGTLDRIFLSIIQTIVIARSQARTEDVQPNRVRHSIDRQGVVSTKL